MKRKNHFYSRRQLEYIELRASGLTNAEACRRIGIDPSTPFRWREKLGDKLDEDIAKRAKELLSRHIPDVMRELISEATKKGSRRTKIQAIRMILEMAKLYAEKSEIESTNTTTLAFETLSDEELEEQLTKAIENLSNNNHNSAEKGK